MNLSLLTLCSCLLSFFLIFVDGQGNNAVMVATVSFMNSDCTKTVAPILDINSGKYNQQLLCAYFTGYDVTGTAIPSYLGLNMISNTQTQQILNLGYKSTSNGIAYNPDFCSFSSNEILNITHSSTSCITLSPSYTGLTSNVNLLINFNQSTFIDIISTTPFLITIDYFSSNCYQPIITLQVVNDACWPVPIYNNTGGFLELQWGIADCTANTSPTGTTFNSYTDNGCHVSGNEGWGLTTAGYYYCQGWGEEANVDMNIWCGGNWQSYPTHSPAYTPYPSLSPSYRPTFKPSSTIAPTQAAGELLFLPSDCSGGVYSSTQFLNTECFSFCSYNEYDQEGECYYGIVNCDCPGNSNSPWTISYYYSSNYQCLGTPLQVISGTGTNCVNCDDNYYIAIDCHYGATDPSTTVCNTANSSSDSNNNNASVLVGVLCGIGGFLAISVALGVLYYYYYYSVGKSLFTSRANSAALEIGHQKFPVPPQVVENPIKTN